MSRPRFLADHNLRDRIVDGVLRREPSIDFFLARELGLDATPDDRLLAAARRGGSCWSRTIRTR